MPVGVMLAAMSSKEITEWMAYYAIRAEESNPKKGNTPAEIRAMFAHRVKKKGD